MPSSVAYRLAIVALAGLGLSAARASADLIIGDSGVNCNPSWYTPLCDTNRYFNGDADADIGQTGGAPGADGVLNNNDWVVFLNWYFGPCT